MNPPTVTGTSTNAELERLRGLVVAELTQANCERRSARVVHSAAVPYINAELAALRKERHTLQASLHAFQTDNNARRKQARTLATLSVDLVPVNSAVASSSTSTAMDVALLALPQRQDRSSTM